MAASVADIQSRQHHIQTISQLRHDLMDGKDLSRQEMLEFFNNAASIIQSLPDYDVIGMEALVERLRHELKHIHERQDGLNSINKLSTQTRVSRPYLSKFRDGGMVCMNIMNRIAEAFGIRYLIENYADPKDSPIE